MSLAEADSVFQQRDYERSQNLYEKVAQATEKSGDISSQTEALSQVARCYLIAGDSVERLIYAGEYFQAFLEVAAVLHEVAGEADRYLTSAIIDIQYCNSRAEYMSRIMKNSLDILGQVEGMLVGTAPQ